MPMDGETSILSVLVNGYFDFENDGPITPYVSAGLGFANVDIEVAGASDDDSVIAYQVGAGVGYALNEQLTLDAKYRYFATTDPEFGTTEAEIDGHNLILGLRASF